MSDLRPAAGYIRVAWNPQVAISNLVERQRHSIEQEAIQRGYVVVQWYLDIGSGSRPTLQPDLQCLIDDCCSGTRPYLAIFVSSLSRFSRDALATVAYQSSLQRHGLRIFSAESTGGSR